MKPLATIQMEVLNALMTHKTRRYTDIKTSLKIENNLLNHHLLELQHKEYITKTADNEYTLTDSGKEFANRFDNTTAQIERQAKIGVWVMPLREHNGQQQFLMETRLKHPFYGCKGILTGKIQYGESIYEAAKRELFEETRLTGDAVLVSIEHIRDIPFDDENKILMDKFAFIMVVKEPTGELREAYDEGAFEWVNVSDMHTKLVPSYTKDTVLHLLSIINVYNTQQTDDIKVPYKDYKRAVDTF